MQEHEPARPRTKPPRIRRAVALAALAAVSAAAGMPGVASAGEEHSQWSAPERVPPGQRGNLISERPLTGAAALPSAGRNRLVNYVSEDADGRPITVSGVVSLPETAPPPGGWPVISWAHGTTGTADMCAPSADTANGPAHGYLSLVNETLDRWVANGFAVVQTDYEGLGTPGGHPYLNGRSAANTVLDMVRAAREADHRVGRDWFAIGHSQGGHAALFAAAAKHQRRDVNLLGAVAIAPGGTNVSDTVAYIRSGGPGVERALAFLPTLLLGAAAAEPEIVPSELLTDEAEPLLAAGRTGCLAKTREVAATVPTDNVFEADADLEAFTEYLDDQEPGGLELEVPTLVAQGADDTTVAKAATDHLVETLDARPPRLDYRVYAGADHRESVAASFEDALRFANALREGHGPPGTR